MNELEKKLVDSAKVNATQSQQLVDSAKLLLSDNEREERDVLRSVGLDWQIREMDSKTEQLKIKSDMGVRYAKSIVTKQEIDQLCNDYRLYLMPASEYAGTIPPELGAELVRYCKEHNIVTPASSSHSKFFVIAPPKMFINYRSPMNNLKDAITDTYTSYQNRVRALRADPILVYQTTEHNGHYAIIRSWGEEQTWLRRIYALMTKRMSLEIVGFAVFFLLLGLLYGIATWQYRKFLAIDIANDVPNEGVDWVVAGIVGWIICVIVACLITFNEWTWQLKKRWINLVTNRSKYGVRDY